MACIFHLLRTIASANDTFFFDETHAECEHCIIYYNSATSYIMLFKVSLYLFIFIPSNILTNFQRFDVSQKMSRHDVLHVILPAVTQLANS